jgi:hypothetical protein
MCNNICVNVLATPSPTFADLRRRSKRRRAGAMAGAPIPVDDRFRVAYQRNGELIHSKGEQSVDTA